MANGSDDETVLQPTRKKMRFSFTEEIKVIVGREKQSFTVYKTEICARSKFFKAACSERWTKPNEMRTIELPDDSPFSFDLYLHCLYKNQVDVGDLDDKLPDEGQDEAFEQTQLEHRTVKAYILADKLRDVISANLLIDYLIDYYVKENYVCDENTAALVANNSAAESPLTKLMVDMLAHTNNAVIIEDVCSLEATPKDLICQVLIEKHKILNPKLISGRRFLREQPKCDYHQHDELHPICGDDCKRRDLVGAKA